MDIEDRTFNIIMEDGKKVTADLIMNFNYLDNHYCIYGINKRDKVDIYCAKNISGQLMKIVNPQEQEFVNRVVNKIINVIKER